MPSLAVRILLLGLCVRGAAAQAASTPAVCAPACRCDGDGGADCSGRGLSSVPSGLSAFTYYLWVILLSASLRAISSCMWGFMCAGVVGESFPHVRGLQGGEKYPAVFESHFERRMSWWRNSVTCFNYCSNSVTHSRTLSGELNGLESRIKYNSAWTLVQCLINTLVH